MFKELFTEDATTDWKKSNKNDSEPIQTPDANPEGGFMDSWNTVGRILLVLRMENQRKPERRTNMTRKKLSSSLYDPDESSYSFDKMIKKGYIKEVGDSITITDKGLKALTKATK